MKSSIYAKAYVEVLAVLNCLDKKQYNMIPKTEIELLQKNCNKEYKFEIQKNQKIQDLKISKEANAVLIVLFQKYFTNEQQRKKLKEVLLQNYEEQENKKRLTYNTNIFEQKQQEKILKICGQQPKAGAITNEEKALVKYKENMLLKLFNRIKKFWHRIWNK